MSLVLANIHQRALYKLAAIMQRLHQAPIEGMKPVEPLIATEKT